MAPGTVAILSATSCLHLPYSSRHVTARLRLAATASFEATIHWRVTHETLDFDY